MCTWRTTEHYNNLDKSSVGKISYGTSAMFDYEQNKSVSLIATTNHSILCFAYNINSHKKLSLWPFNSCKKVSLCHSKRKATRDNRSVVNKTSVSLWHSLPPCHPESRESFVRDPAPEREWGRVCKSP